MDAESPPDIADAERLAPPESVRTALDDLSEWRYLGRGGFSTVWVAHERHMDRLVAVKILERTLDHSGRLLFERETAALGRLSDHPGIISIYRAGVTASATGWLVMEYASGGTCADLLRDQGRLPWPQAVDLMLSVTDALAAAQDQGLLHLDIKPSNILIGAYGGAELGDFGLVRPEVLADAETLEGLHLTPHHSAPEVIHGERPTARSDVWSATSTLFELIDGRPPFSRPQADSPGQVMRRIEVEQPRSLAVDEPTGNLRAVIEKGLEKDPEKRFQTAHELHEALARIRRPEAAPTDAHHATRRWPRLVIAALAPVVFVASLSWWALRGEVSKPATPETHAWFVGVDAGRALGSIDISGGRIDTMTFTWGGPVAAAGGRLWGVDVLASSGGTGTIAGVRSIDRQGRQTSLIVPSGLDTSGHLQVISSGPDAATLWMVQAAVSADLAIPTDTTIWAFDASEGRELGRSSLAGTPSGVFADSPVATDDTLLLPWSDDHGGVRVARFAADGTNPTSFGFASDASHDDAGRPGPSLDHLRLAAGVGRLYAVAEDSVNGLLRLWELDPENLTVLGASSHEMIASAHPVPPVVVDGTAQMLISRSFRQTEDAVDNRAELVSFGTDHQVRSRRVDITSDSLPIGSDKDWRVLTLGTRLYLPLWDDSSRSFTGLASVDAISGDVGQYRSSEKELNPPLEVTDAGIALGSNGQVVVLDPQSLQVLHQMPALMFPFELATVSGRVVRLDRSDGSVALLDPSGKVERTWTTGLGDTRFLGDARSGAVFLVGRSDAAGYIAPMGADTGPGPLQDADDVLISEGVRLRGGTTWVVGKSKDRNGFHEYRDLDPAWLSTNPDRFIPTDAVLKPPRLSLAPFDWSTDALYVIIDTERGPGDPIVATGDPLCPAGVRVCLQRIPVAGGASTTVPLPDDASAVTFTSAGVVVGTLSGVEVRDATTLALLQAGTVAEPASAHVIVIGPGTDGSKIAWYDPQVGRLVVLDSTTLQTVASFDDGRRSWAVTTKNPDQIWYLPGSGATPTGMDLASGSLLTVQPTVEAVTALESAGGRLYLASGREGDVVVADPVPRSSASDAPVDGSRGTR